MVIVVIMVLLLVVVVALVLRIVFRGKRSNTAPGPLIDPLMDEPRYRDGAITYSQFDGGRYKLRVENPYESHTHAMNAGTTARSTHQQNPG